MACSVRRGSPVYCKGSAFQASGGAAEHADDSELAV